MKKTVSLFFPLFLFLTINGSAQMMWAGKPNLYPIAQQQKNWCWAACVEIVLKNAGISVTQSQIVSKVFGAAYDKNASQGEIMGALSGWAVDVYGYPRSLYCQQLRYGANEIQHSLINGWPLIVGIKNRNGSGYHAVVLAAIEYYFLSGQVAIQTVTLKDPYYGKSIKISWNEFLRRQDGMYLKFWIQ